MYSSNPERLSNLPTDQNQVFPRGEDILPCSCDKPEMYVRTGMDGTAYVDCRSCGKGFVAIYR